MKARLQLCDVWGIFDRLRLGSLDRQHSDSVDLKEMIRACMRYSQECL